MNRATHGRVGQYIGGRLARACVLVAMVLSTMAYAPSVLRAGSGTPALVLSAPLQVAVGEAISVVLTVKNATNLAGYETLVLYDTSAAEFAGLHQQNNDLRRAGRAVDSLTVADLAIGSAIGLYSCPLNDCMGSAGRRPDQGVAGDVRLATLDILPLQAGTLEIRLGATKLVDAAGNPIAVDIPTPTLAVQVGASGAGARYPAPSGTWALAPSALARPPALGALDLTFDSQVTNADLMEVAIEWTTAREQGSPCAAPPNTRRDINHDGCIDVADLQLLANYTQAAPAAPASAAAALTLTVDSTGDGGDASPGNGICATSAGACTLRAAIEETNANAGPDTIAFSIPGGGTQTIHLDQALPTLSGGNTTIDGYTQPGASPNTDQRVSNAQIRIEIEGTGVSGIDGFRITSKENVLRGLSLYNFHRPIWLYGSGGHDNIVAGNFIGTDAAGTFALKTTGAKDASGVYLSQRASRNRIGGTALADRNVVSGNGRTGVALWYEWTDNNVIFNNLIGLHPSGTTVVGNGFHGIDINSGVSYTVVGGTGPQQRNVVVGSVRTGIEISHAGSTSYNQVVGNFVGTDVTGTKMLPGSGNKWFGIQVKDRVYGNVVADNVVGGSGRGGIRIDEFGSCCVRLNRFANNRVGVSLDGSAIPNSVAGFNVTAGNATIGPNNIVAHNPIGIRIEGDASDGNLITRNSIYSNDGLGIDLAPIGQVNPNDPDDADTGPNQQLNFPVLQTAVPQQVTGTACAGCTVEIFVTDSGSSEYGEGKTFVGAITAAADGSFVVPISGARSGDSITATAASTRGNTSEFAHNFVVGAGPAPGSTPTITQLSPASASAGGVGFSLTVIGTNFSASSVVKWNGAARPTTFINSTELRAEIAATDIATPGTAAVIVLNGSGKQSSAASFTITPAVPAPAITSLNPSAANAGGPDFTLTIIGANFSSASVAQWNGQDRPTTFVSATQLQASISAADIADHGTAAVTVLDQASKQLSGAASFVIHNPAALPTITSLNPKSATAGGANFILKVNGTNFTEDSVVEWNGVEHATTFISSTKLEAAIGAADIATAGVATITVAESVSGATSNAMTFSITAAAPDPSQQKHVYVALLKR
jgi:CSLREA domain-containing protein